MDDLTRLSQLKCPPREANFFELEEKIASLHELNRRFATEESKIVEKIQKLEIQKSDVALVKHFFFVSWKIEHLFFFLWGREVEGR